MNSRRGLYLSQCQRLMATTMAARAPSLSTLRRHVQAGLLEGCRVPSAGKRFRYDPERLKEHYARWLEQPEPDQRQRSPADLSLHLDPEQIEQISRAIAGVMLPQIAALAKEVAGLNTVRSSLMLKYDAAASLALERAESMSRQLGEARNLVHLDVRMASLAAEVSRLSERLSQLAPESQ